MIKAEKQTAAYSHVAEEEMKRLLSAQGIPAQLQETMAYSVLAGGKRLRPALLLGACEMCGGTIERALPFACAMEFIHTYSLIHDDLPAMDNDDYRRGRLTSHKKYGEAKAILAGDGLLSYAFEILLNACCDQNSVQAARIIASAAGVRGMLAGQWVDVDLNGNVFDASTMEYIHLNKTAAMIIGALRAGAFCAGAQKEEIESLSCYGREIGYTFQIIDDILDVEGSFAELGKDTGSDAANQKTTYVTLYGIDGARKKAKEHTQLAVAALQHFGGRAEFFIELAEYLLNRNK